MRQLQSVHSSLHVFSGNSLWAAHDVNSFLLHPGHCFCSHQTVKSTQISGWWLNWGITDALHGGGVREDAFRDGSAGLQQAIGITPKFLRSQIKTGPRHGGWSCSHPEQPCQGQRGAVSIRRGHSTVTQLCCTPGSFQKYLSIWMQCKAWRGVSCPTLPGAREIQLNRELNVKNIPMCTLLLPSFLLFYSGHIPLSSSFRTALFTLHSLHFLPFLQKVPPHLISRLHSCSWLPTFYCTPLPINPLQGHPASCFPQFLVLAFWLQHKRTHIF